MDVSKSSLNPYASAYIPLARRGKGNEGRPNEMKPGKFVDGRTTSIKHSEAHKKLTDQSPDEETEMDLAYLAMSFPGVSDQSISGVYYANGCDVDASVHMLKQLELPAEFFQQLPDTLDIGDVVEFGSSAESKFVLPTVLSGEASGSSSGTSKFMQ